MASLLFAGCIRSWTRQQGSASNLLSRCWLPTCQQQCAQAVSGQGHIHTTSGSGQTCSVTNSSSSCLSSGAVPTEWLEHLTLFLLLPQLVKSACLLCRGAWCGFLSVCQFEAFQNHLRCTSGPYLCTYCFVLSLISQPMNWFPAAVCVCGHLGKCAVMLLCSAMCKTGLL